MKTVVIANETNQRHDKLSAKITQSTVKLAPYVTRVSGLALPDSIRFRLTTPSGLGRAFRQFHRRTARSLHPQSEQERMLLKAFNVVAPAVTTAFALTAWPCLGGVVVVAADGAPEVVMVPESFRHLNMSDRRLEAIIAHELDHLAVFATYPAFHEEYSQGILERIRAEEEPPKVSEGSPFNYYVEGRAVWTQRSVTHSLHGDDMAYLHDGSVRTGLSTRAKITGSVFKALKLVNVDHYRDGATFFAAVFEAGGLDMANAPLVHPELLPTRDEVHNPEEWITRLGKFREQETASTH